MRKLQEIMGSGRVRTLISLLLSFVLLAMIVVFIGCGDDETGGPEPVEPAKTVLMTVDPVCNLTYGAQFDPYVNVTLAEDYTTADVDVQGGGAFTDANGVINSLGVFQLVYTLSADGAMLDRQYVRAEVSFGGAEVVKNGDFAAKGEGWTVTDANAVYSSAGVALTPDAGKTAALTQSRLSLKGNRTYALTISAKSASLYVYIGMKNGSFTHGFVFGSELSEKTVYFHCASDSDDAYIELKSDTACTVKSIEITRYNYSGDHDAPIFYGVYNKSLLPGMSDNFMKGVSAIDVVAGTLTGKIKVTVPEGVTVNGSTATFTSEGVYEFVYTVSDNEDNTATATRIYTVANSFPKNHSFIDEKFEGDMRMIYSDCYNDAEAEVGLDNGALKVDVTVLSPSQYDPFPRVFFGNVTGFVDNHTIPFEKNGQYRLSFKAKSSVARQFVINIAELLDTAPWLKLYTPQITVSTTDEWTEMTYDFTSSITDTVGSIMFSFGNVGISPVSATFWIDDVSLVKINDKA